MFAASHSACANGTIMSSVPCQTATGTAMSFTEKPHGRSIVRSSSCHPAMPCSPARRKVAASSSAISPVRAARSTGGASVPSESATSAAVAVKTPGA